MNRRPGGWRTGLCCSPRGKDGRGGSQGRRTAGPSAAASLNPRLSLKSRVSAQDSRGMEGGPQRSTLENQSEASGAGGTQATRPVSSSQDTHPVAAGAGLGAWPDSQPLPPRPRGRCPQRGTVTQTEGDEPAIPPGTTSLPTPTQNPTSTPAPGSWGRGRTGVLGEGQKGEPHFLSPPCLCSRGSLYKPYQAHNPYIHSFQILRMTKLISSSITNGAL